MDRRSFIKGLIALASAPAIGKYVNIFKTEGAREGIEQVASQGVDFFNSVIKKVMDEGTLVKEQDRISTFKHPDRPDITVDVDQTTGSSSVYFDTDEGTKAVGEIQKTMDETTGGKVVEELFEQEEIYGPTGRDAQEGISGGITNLEKFLKGKRGFAAGGRVGMFRGGVPKGLQAAMRAIMSKYGDDAITTADKAPQPGKTIQEEIMDFQTRNPNPKRLLTDDEIRDYEEVLGDTEYWMMDGTVGEAEEALRQSKEYEADMFREYKAGKLDPEPGEISRGRLQKLQEKLEEMEMTGDKRLMTPDEMEELMFLEKKFAKEALDAKAQGTRKMSDEEIAELKALSDMGYKDGGLVNLTAIKIPDNNQSGVESLFKRR